MKLIRLIGAGAVAMSAGEFAIAAHPPLDRPTPPPCAADGICYPNAGTWGWYQQQWRRWPTEELEPTPATKATAPGKAIPDIPAYETLPPEQEDRRAPPPTKPRAEAEEGAEAPRERPLTAPPGGEMEAPLTAPPGGSLTTPPDSLLTPPSSPLRPAPSTPFSPGPSTPSTSPLAPPTDRMPWENGAAPTGDWDPPPAPPTATARAVTVDRAPARQAPNRFTPAKPNRPAVPSRQSPNSDPPPTLPVALANAAY